jgi:hypothetical protein
LLRDFGVEVGNLVMEIFNLMRVITNLLSETRT